MSIWDSQGYWFNEDNLATAFVKLAELKHVDGPDVNVLSSPQLAKMVVTLKEYCLNFGHSEVSRSMLGLARIGYSKDPQLCKLF